MDKTNVKCPVCGYIFETEENKTEYFCPLCSSEYDFEKARELFENSDNVTEKTVTENKSFSRKILELGLFFVSFSAFIIILYYIINYIVGNWSAQYAKSLKCILRLLKLIF